MSIEEEKKEITIEADDSHALYWRTHPVKQKPLVATLVTIFIFVVAALIYDMTDSKIFPILALVILFMSLGKFYLPTKFKLTETHVIIKTTTQTIAKEWQLYRSYYPDKNGVLLSPFEEPTRLENFRGIYLMFDNNKDEVLAYLDRHIKNTSDDDSTTNEVEA